MDKFKNSILVVVGGGFHGGYGNLPTTLLIDKDAASIAAYTDIAVRDAHSEELETALLGVLAPINAAGGAPGHDALTKLKALLSPLPPAALLMHQGVASAAPSALASAARGLFTDEFCRQYPDLLEAGAVSFAEAARGAVAGMRKAEYWIHVEEACELVNRFYPILRRDSAAFTLCRRFFKRHLRLCWFHAKRAMQREIASKMGTIPRTRTSSSPFSTRCFWRTRTQGSTLGGRTSRHSSRATRTSSLT